MIFKTHPASRMNCSAPINGDGSFTTTCKIALAVGYHPEGVTRFVVHSALNIPTTPSYYCNIWAALALNGVIKYDRHVRKYVAGPNFSDYHTHMQNELVRISKL